MTGAETVQWKTPAMSPELTEGTRVGGPGAAGLADCSVLTTVGVHSAEGQERQEIEWRGC